MHIPADSVWFHVGAGTARTYTVDATLECLVVCLRKVKGYWGGEGLEAVIGVPLALARKNIPLTLLLRRPLLFFLLQTTLQTTKSNYSTLKSTKRTSIPNTVEKPCPRQSLCCKSCWGSCELPRMTLQYWPSPTSISIDSRRYYYFECS